MRIDDLLSEHGSRLTAAERRVADVIHRSPDTVAFGTVADVASAAGAGVATVVRLATKLGFDGYTAMQAAVQAEISDQLRPAAERIRRDPASVALDRHRAVELDNVERSLDRLDAAVVERLVTRLADDTVDVVFLSGEESVSIADHVGAQLLRLRPRVRVLRGSEVAVRRDLAVEAAPAVVVAIDLRRYDRWLLDAVRFAARLGHHVVAVTDGPLSPLVEHADDSIVVAADAVGPFDSHVGTLAVLGFVVAEVAVARRDVARDRLDRVEAAWTDVGALTDG